jgi:hypothetical protein
MKEVKIIMKNRLFATCLSQRERERERDQFDRLNDRNITVAEALEATSYKKF